MATGTIQTDLVLLWENSDTTVDFDSQTISLDLSRFKFCVVTFVLSGTLNYWQTVIAPANGGNSTVFFTRGMTGSGAVNFTIRNFVPDTNGIQFKNSVYKALNSTSAATTDNGYAIPVQIYGVNP